MKRFLFLAAVIALTACTSGSRDDVSSYQAPPDSSVRVVEKIAPDTLVLSDSSRCVIDTPIHFDRVTVGSTIFGSCRKIGAPSDTTASIASPIYTASMFGRYDLIQAAENSSFYHRHFFAINLLLFAFLCIAAAVWFNYKREAPPKRDLR